MISHDFIIVNFDYDPLTGVLLKKSNNKECNTNDDGYFCVSVKGTRQKVHRLIWLYVYGEFPKGQIDHINGVGTDNRISNLRDVSIKENSKNQSLAKNNKSGIIGVHWNKKRRKWRVTLSKRTVGSFSTLLDAACKRITSQRDNGFHENHGRNNNERR